MEIQASFLRWLEYRHIIFTDTADSTTDRISVLCCLFLFINPLFNVNTQGHRQLNYEMDVLSGQL